MTLNQRDDISRKSAQLEALLYLLTGEEGGEAFRTINPEMQSNLFWLSANLATEIRELANGDGDEGGNHA